MHFNNKKYIYYYIMSNINLFSCEKECFGDVDTYNILDNRNTHKYNYINCGDKDYRNKNITEQIYLPNVNKNMIINCVNTGRYGNYIHAALNCVILFLIFEKYLFDNYSNIKIDYENIVQNLKKKRSNFLLYSLWNCRIMGDVESGVEDKYYFKTRGVDSFKYFNCYHLKPVTKSLFEDDICKKDVDVIISFNLYKIYATGNKLYFVLKTEDDKDIISTENSAFDIYYILSNFYDPNMLNEISNIRICNKNIIEDIKKKTIFGNIRNIYILSILKYIVNNESDKFFNDSNQEHHWYDNQLDDDHIQNLAYIMNNYQILGGYELHDFSNETVMKKELSNELEKCYLTDENKIILFYINKMSHLSENINMEKGKYIKYAKEILFEDDKDLVNNFFNMINYKYSNKKLAIAHFRGGDFEKYKNYQNKFKVLRPQYYIEKIQQLINTLKIENKDLVLVCSFHPNDKIFKGYINIIKNKFDGLIILTENDLINIHTKCFSNDQIPDPNQIFMNESKHVLFMSLFLNMILSNSTYAKIASDINVNENKQILKCVGEDIYCMNQNKIAGMNLIFGNNIIDWDIGYMIFGFLYEKEEQNLNNTNDKIFSLYAYTTDSAEISLDNIHNKNFHKENWLLSTVLYQPKYVIINRKITDDKLENLSNTIIDYDAPNKTICVKKNTNKYKISILSLDIEDIDNVDIIKTDLKLTSDELLKPINLNQGNTDSRIKYHKINFKYKIEPQCLQGGYIVHNYKKKYQKYLIKNSA
jgi:hypothetical protein